MLKKRLLSALLCLCMVAGMLPTMSLPAQAAGTGIIDRINSFRTRYPHGYYWNHYGTSVNEYGVTDAPCPFSRAAHNEWSNIYQYCNSYAGAYQCMGFAFKFVCELFGVNRSALIYNDDPANVQVGDYVRFANSEGGHSFVVIERNGNTVTLVECNFGSADSTNCQIRWGRQLDITGENYNMRFSHSYHAPNYDEINGSPLATAQNIGEDFYAYIHNTYSGHALENHSNNVQLAAANNYDPRQIWHFIHLGYNQYKIINMYDGRCLDTNGTSVRVLSFTGDEKQLWQICGTDSHSNSTLYYLAPPGYGTNNTNHTSVLDVAYGNDDYVPTGRDVQLSKNWYGGSGSSFINDGPFHKAQTFQIIKISQDDIKSRLAYNAGSNFYSRISFNGAYLQAMGGTGSQAYDVRTTQTFGNDPRQIWHFVRQSDGSYKIVNEYGDLVLSISGSEATDHANVQTSSDTNITAQRWYLIYSPGDSTYRIASALKYPSELYSIDIDADDGTNAQIYHQNESAHQQFSISKISYTKPAAPSVPANIQVSATSSGTTITWDEVPTVGAYDSRSYLVYLANLKNEVFIPQTSVNGTRYVSDVVLPNGEYRVIVEAHNTKYYHLFSDIGYCDFSIAPELTTYTVEVNATEGGTASGGGTYSDGESVTVTATASEGYEFRGWTENGAIVSSNAEYTFTVNADRTLTATFKKKQAPVPVTHTISISADPAAGGTVVGGGTYQNNESVTIIATANSGYTFKQWTENGSEVSTSASYTFTATADRILVAVFEKDTEVPDPPTPVTNYTVSVNASPTAGGTVSGGGTYQENTSVTVKATASSGYIFKGWTQSGTQVSTDTSYTFPVTGNTSLTAVFETDTPTPTPTYRVTVNATTGGTVSGGGTYQSSAPATVTATPNNNYRFVEWREDGKSVSTDTTYTFSASADRTLTAVFERIELPPTPSYTVSVSASPTEGGSVSGGDSYQGNTSVTVTATANEGYLFKKWTEGGSEVSTDTSYTFTVSRDRALVAVFEKKEEEKPPTPLTPTSYTVSLSTSPTAGGTVSGEGSYQSGTSVTVTATPNSNYRFTGWTENGTQVSTSASYTFTISADRTLVAGFIYVGGSTNPGGNPGSGTTNPSTGNTSTTTPHLHSPSTLTAPALTV